jgi:hypothetical protein
MIIEVRINRDVIGTVEIHNVTANGPDPKLPIHTYDWTYGSDHGAKLDGRVTHRFSDGAMVLASKVLDEIAVRYEIAAVLVADTPDSPKVSPEDVQPRETATRGECRCGHAAKDHYHAIADCQARCLCDDCPDDTGNDCWCAGFKPRSDR